jgi:hypothetical protein
MVEVVAKFETISRNLPEGTEENHAEDFNQDSPSVYKLEA